MKRYLVTGAGGFIGHHMVKRLKVLGHYVRGVDIVYPQYEPSPADEFCIADLRSFDSALAVCRGMDAVFHFAADMGGIGYIYKYPVTIMRNNGTINFNVAEAVRAENIGKILFSSSACIYPVHKQEMLDATALKESDAYPANPESEYGWEKLTAERYFMGHAFANRYDIRIARFHNIYGPLGAYEGGREKAPAALCRKIALAKDSIEVWGDGFQQRSFLYIDDCIDGLLLLLDSDYAVPINIGSDRMVTINHLICIIENIAGKEVRRVYQPNETQGVRSRNCDSVLAKRVLDWTPKYTLETGLTCTYEWIYSELKEAGRL